MMTTQKSLGQEMVMSDDGGNRRGQHSALSSSRSCDFSSPHGRFDTLSSPFLVAGALLGLTPAMILVCPTTPPSSTGSALRPSPQIAPVQMWTDRGRGTALGVVRILMGKAVPRITEPVHHQCSRCGYLRSNDWSIASPTHQQCRR